MGRTWVVDRRRPESRAGRRSAHDVRAPQDDEHDELVARLDAAVAHLYGLTEDDVRVIFETFHVGWDYTPRLTAVLEHYRDLA